MNWKYSKLEAPHRQRPAGQGMTTREEHYIGDAVYASFDGWQIKLRTDDGNNQVIYLEPSVVRSLVEYAKRVGVLGNLP